MATIKDRGRPEMANLVTDANLVLEALYEQLNASVVHSFGSSMLLHNADSIVATTLAHRVLKKFQKPDPTVAKRLHDECVTNWLSYDEGLAAFSMDDVSNGSKSILYRASALLREWLASFKPDMSRTDFTPGETLTSLQGKVSMYQKLRNRSAWTCTHDAFDDFARLVYNTRWLKRSAKVHMRKLSRAQQRRIYGVFKASKHVGYAVFKHRLEHEVVTLVHGGRFSSVEKNNTTRRPIIVAPLGNMLLQRTVAHPLRDILRRVGNDLETGQDLHSKRISDSSVATVDFSGASDSNATEAIVKMFPANLTRYLLRYRDPYVLIGEGKARAYYPPKKLSSMGCGFTFEVMTMLLLAIARVLDPQATVYGDDVVIKNDAAAAFTKVMGELMWNVNETKTFINSPFRESCGAFYLDGYGYITCFDIRYLESVNDVIVTANKLYLISRDNPRIDVSLYRQAYEALLLLVPALLVGPVQHTTNPDLGFVMCENSRRKHMRSAESRALWKRLAPNALELAKRLQWDEGEVVLCTIPRFINKKASKTLRRVDCIFRTAWYLKSGGVVNDDIRNEGSWRYSVYLVSPSGRASLQILKEDKRLCDLRRKVGPPILDYSSLPVTRNL